MPFPWCDGVRDQQTAALWLWFGDDMFKEKMSTNTKVGEKVWSDMYGVTPFLKKKL